MVFQCSGQSAVTSAAAATATAAFVVLSVVMPAATATVALTAAALMVLVVTATATTAAAAARNHQFLDLALLQRKQCATDRLRIGRQHLDALIPQLARQGLHRVSSCGSSAPRMTRDCSRRSAAAQ